MSKKIEIEHYDYENNELIEFEIIDELEEDVYVEKPMLKNLDKVIEKILKEARNETNRKTN